MPNWFAKTREMAAIDRYFSLQDAGSEPALVDRYLGALARLGAPDRYFDRSDALDNTGWDPAEIEASLHGHFVGEWIHRLYPTSPEQYANIGGRNWPQVGSQRIVDRIRYGTTIAFHKALGRDNLERAGVQDPVYIDDLFKSEVDIGVDIDRVLPLAMSWNCVAPTGDDYFEADALRGPTVVELAIATPRPYGHGSVMPLVEEYELGLREPPQIGASS